MFGKIHHENSIYKRTAWGYEYARTPNWGRTAGHYAGYLSGTAGGMTLGLLGMGELMMFGSMTSMMAVGPRALLYSGLTLFSTLGAFSLSRLGILFDVMFGATIATVKTNSYSYVGFNDAKRVMVAQQNFMRHITTIDEATLEPFFQDVLQDYLVKSPSRLKQSHNSKQLIQYLAQETCYKEKMLRVFEYLHNSTNFGCNLHKTLIVNLVKYDEQGVFSTNSENATKVPPELCCPLSGKMYLFPVKIRDLENGDGLIYCLSSLIEHVNKEQTYFLKGDHGFKMEVNFEKLIPSEGKQKQLTDFLEKQTASEPKHAFNLDAIKAPVKKAKYAPK